MKKAKVLAAGLLLGMLTRGAVPVLAAEDTVMQGVWLGAVEISGMTEAEVEAEARKQEEKALQQGIQMQMNLHTVTINVQDLGLTVDTDDAARRRSPTGVRGIWFTATGSSRN